MRLLYKARFGETNHYVDVTSLYPYVCKYEKFPLGLSVVHVGDACKEKEACLHRDGLMKCTIVPTGRLYHPVLPFRDKQKLMFSLPNMFSNLKYWEFHHKTDEYRALTGTWVIDEVRHALQKRYRFWRFTKSMNTT